MAMSSIFEVYCMYEIFKKLLEENSIKAVDVSRATGVSQTVLSEWKKGKYTPSPEKLLKIANFFEVPLSYLITGKMIETDNSQFINVLVNDISKADEISNLIEKYQFLDYPEQQLILEMIDKLYERKNLIQDLKRISKPSSLTDKQETNQKTKAPDQELSVTETPDTAPTPIDPAMQALLKRMEALESELKALKAEKHVSTDKTASEGDTE